jgi:hypothetical protein
VREEGSKEGRESWEVVIPSEFNWCNSLSKQLFDNTKIVIMKNLKLGKRSKEEGGGDSSS